jgi:hypothetical protein
MRITLALDDDVAALLKSAHSLRGGSREDIANCALRSGLLEIATRSEPTGLFRTRSVDLGQACVDIDNVAETLAYMDA